MKKEKETIASSLFDGAVDDPSEWVHNMSKMGPPARCLTPSIHSRERKRKEEQQKAEHKEERRWVTLPSGIRVGMLTKSEKAEWMKREGRLYRDAPIPPEEKAKFTAQSLEKVKQHKRAKQQK